MWDIMKIQKPHDDSPWMCVGDMNQIFHVDEKKGEMLQIFKVFNKPEKKGEMLQIFQDTVDYCGLVELQVEGQCFTWTNQR